MMQITERLLPYHSNLEARNTDTLDLVVLHCTELPSLEMAREYGERILYPESATGASGHYYIDRDGSVWRYVRDDRVARHAIGFNLTSLGIEMINSGRYPQWFFANGQTMSEPYAEAQLDSLKELLQLLRRQYPGLVQLARHSDLDTRTIPAEDDPTVQVRRRIDPGPLFPWSEFEIYWRTL